MTTLVTKNFNGGADNPLGTTDTDWETTLGTGCRVNTGNTYVDAFGNGSDWAMSGIKSSVENFADDQWAQVVVTTYGSGDDCGCLVRGSADGDGYAIHTYAGGTYYELVRFDNGVATRLDIQLQTLTNGDVLYVEAQGTAIKGFVNDTEILSATDSTYTSGQPNITYLYTNTRATQADDFEAGDFSSGGGGGEIPVIASSTYSRMRKE